MPETQRDACDVLICALNLHLPPLKLLSSVSILERSITALFRSIKAAQTHIPLLFHVLFLLLMQPAGEQNHIAHVYRA